MSTHATIAYTNGAQCSAIYLHADGDLSFAGATLLHNYNSKERAGALVALGNLSILKERELHLTRRSTIRSITRCRM